jgi:hypothetical protein
MDGWRSRVNDPRSKRPAREPQYPPIPAAAITDFQYYARELLPLLIARQRVDGGAPYLHEGGGRPQYEPDELDTPETYPFDPDEYLGANPDDRAPPEGAGAEHCEMAWPHYFEM